MHLGRALTLTLTIFVLLLIPILLSCGGDKGPNPQERESLVDLSDNTTNIPADSSDVIEGFDEQSGSLILSSSSSYAQDLETGDILIGQDDQEAPNGFLRKVVSSTIQGDSMLIVTEQATILEAFDELDIWETHELKPSDVKSAKLRPGARFSSADQETFMVEIDCVFFDQDDDLSTTDDQVVLSGTYSFSADLHTEIKLKWLKLQRYETWIEATSNMALDLKAGLQWSFEEEMDLEIVEFKMAAIPVATMVWLVPTLSVEAHISGDLTVTIETSISYTQTTKCGFGYENDSYYNIVESERDYSYAPPHLAAAFDCEAGASLNAACLLYSVAGPYVGVKAGLHFHSELTSSPCMTDLDFDLEAVVSGVVGIECDVLELDYSTDVDLFTQPIGDWTFPLSDRGTIRVTPRPAELTAPWRLLGPCGLDTSGAGPAVLLDKPGGEYSITYHSVSGWTTPPEVARMLEDGDTLVFDGHYVEIDPEPDSGTIIVYTEPDSLGASWTLTGPNSYQHSGVGDDTLNGLFPGEYSITWHDVDSIWITPSNAAGNLQADDTLVFDGTYRHKGDSTGWVEDHDGNIYRTVKIGDQWWMAENLKVTHYRNDDPIPLITDNTNWSTRSSGAMCEYANSHFNVETYGYLYNWFAAVDERGLAPEGWHVPTDDEWQQLIDYLGGHLESGGKLKDTILWKPPNTGANNETGFSAIPGGLRAENGTYLYYTERAYFWSSTAYGSGGDAWDRRLHYNNNLGHEYYNPKRTGMSIRCIKDTEPSPKSRQGDLLSLEKSTGEPPARPSVPE